MPYTTPRPVSEAEYQVLRAAFYRAVVGDAASITDSQLRSLVVHSVCKCGCASIGFLAEGCDRASGTRILADGLGLSEERQQVGVLVYGSPSEIAELEVHWPNAEPAPLPVPSSIVPWGRGEEVRSQGSRR
jgi:hypothetical protein